MLTLVGTINMLHEMDPLTKDRTIRTLNDKVDVICSDAEILKEHFKRYLEV